MKIASLMFALLLLAAHTEGDVAARLDQPLSVFRDREQGWLGYALFAALTTVGVLYTGALAQSRRAGETAISSLAVLLLFVVATTPSRDAIHLSCSLLLFLLLFSYFAWLLLRAVSIWLPFHLAVPGALAAATHFQSYGIWQKSFILYFVVAVVLHHHLLERKPLVGKRGQALKRRQVYQLEPGREWSRRTMGSDKGPCRGIRSPLSYNSGIGSP
jgi:hypothetical protein